MSPSRRRILVTAATGRQGRAATRALRESGWLVRALVRDPQSPAAAELAATGAQIAVGDLDDPGAIAAALDDVHGVFLSQPGFMSPELTPGLGPDSELHRGRAVLAAAVAAGVGHLVYSSALGADRGLSPLLAPKRALEAELAESGLPATIIRPVGFAENYAGPLRGLGPDGTIRTPAPPHVVEQLIAVRDIGVFAALASPTPIGTSATRSSSPAMSSPSPRSPMRSRTRLAVRSATARSRWRRSAALILTAPAPWSASTASSPRGPTSTRCASSTRGCSTSAAGWPAVAPRRSSRTSSRSRRRVSVRPDLGKRGSEDDPAPNTTGPGAMPR